MPIAVPRDREGGFEPALVKTGQTRIDGMDDKIIGLYAAGLTVCDIRAHLEDVYGLQVSPDLPLIAASGDCRAVDQPGPPMPFWTRFGNGNPGAGADVSHSHF